MKICPNGTNNDPNKDLLYYALTMTYKKTIYSNEYLIYKGLKFVDEKLKRYNYEVVYELTQQGLIHFHALIWVKEDKRLNYLKDIGKWRTNGYLLNKQCFDIGKWKEYLRKEETYKIFGLPDQIITHENLDKNMYILDERERIKINKVCKENKLIKENTKYWIDNGFMELYEE